MLPILSVGPLTLRTPGLALLAGLWIMLEVSSRYGARRYQINEDDTYSVVFRSVIVGVVAARLAFVIANISTYSGITPVSRALLAIVSPVVGAEIAVAGILACVGSVYWMSTKREIDIVSLVDSLAAGAGVFVIGVGLSNLLSGMTYGVPATVPWAIDLWGAERHPTQIYLVLLGSLMLATTWQMSRQKPDLKKGALSQIVLSVLAVGILVIEPLRADSPVILDGLRIWQIAALTLLLAMMLWAAFSTPLEADAVTAPSEVS